MAKLVFLILCLSPVFSYLTEKDYGEKLAAMTPSLHSHCQLFTGVTEKQIQAVREGNFDAPNSVKRYVACLWTGSGIAEIDLSPNKGVAESIQPPKHKEVNGAQIIKDCLTTGKNSDAQGPAEKFWVVLKCVHDANPDIFMVV